MTAPAIWYIFPSLNLGGAELHAIQLASRLREKGFETGFLTIFEEGDLARKAREEGIPVESLGERHSWNPLTLYHLLRWLRRHPVDILHTYLFGFHFFAGLPARLARVPVVISSRRELAEWMRPRHLFLQDLGNWVTDAVITCSKAVERWTLAHEKIKPAKVHTIYNGVDLERFFPAPPIVNARLQLGLPAGAPVIGTVANLSVEKNYPTLLQAAQLVFEKHPEAWFLFIGSGPLEKEIKEQASCLSAGRQIVFAGSRHDIPDLLRTMDIFVLSSVREGFPNVLLEAMAVGKPVVATEVGGIPELIRSGEDGVLVPTANASRMAEALVDLLAQPARAKALGRKAAEKIRQHFSIERMVHDYADFYRDLLKKKGKDVPRVLEEPVGSPASAAP